jgi:ABC-2 type transport system ATP-binding protein
VLLDEPANGLDPEGVLWARGLLKALAAEGRTVFVSSHGMSEMALVADHLIVIGRGRLLADTDMATFIRGSELGDVLVRSPDRDRLDHLLAERGAAVRTEAVDGLAVRGLTGQDISAVAAVHGIVLHELSNRQPSLEEAYMKLTTGATEYRSTAAAER